MTLKLDLKTLLEKYDYFIFDLYGTLIDLRTDEWIETTWVKWIDYLDKKGIRHPKLTEFREDFFSLDKAYRQKPTPFTYPEIDVMEVYDELFTRYGNKKIDSSELFEISYEFRKCSIEYIKLFEGVEEFLSILKKENKKTFILSNAQSSYTLYEIQGFSLDKMVDDYIMSSDFKCMKPDKAFFDAIVLRGGIKKDRAIMFGDSYQNDYLGAKEYGISGLWLNGEDYSDKIYKRFVNEYKR